MIAPRAAKAIDEGLLTVPHTHTSRIEIGRFRCFRSVETDVTQGFGRGKAC